MFHRMLVPLALVAAVALSGGTDAAAGHKNKSSQKKNNKPKQQVVTQPIVRVVDLVIEDITLVEGQLVAHAVATLDVVGRQITQEIEIPIDVGATPGAEGECDILNLALGPVSLDLLGLNVVLDDCAGGPVTVDIVAVEGGGLLGDLLCSIAGGLDSGLSLEELLPLLTEEELATVTDGLVDVLNDLLGQLLDTGTVTTADHVESTQAHVCDILTLEIPEGLHLTLLGLQVDTSGICLDVFAEEGDGNLLGNLLCSLTNLLNNNGNNAGGQRALVKNINKVLNRLDL